MTNQLDKIEWALESSLHELENFYNGSAYTFLKKNTSQALTALRKFREDMYQDIIDECKRQMSIADQREKTATINDDDIKVAYERGRWYCTNDIREWAEKKRSTLIAEQMGGE